ncbi:MAG: UMP kinase, partial [candidate division Zixibacteria bacterium]|nr:UMP kinase [candidate division Zixibacteria bacterium]
METLKYKRPLIKLSGEALMGSKSFGIDPAIVSAICEQLKELTELGAEVAVVVGGGNIYRGLEASKSGVDR